jgi:sodium-dependent phosphate cotransporter
VNPTGDRPQATPDCCHVCPHTASFFKILPHENIVTQSNQAGQRPLSELQLGEDERSETARMATLLSPTTFEKLQSAAITTRSSHDEFAFGRFGSDDESREGDPRVIAPQKRTSSPPEPRSMSKKIAVGFAHVLVVLAATYTFMTSIKLISDGFTLAVACKTKSVFSFANNPVAGVIIGTVATAMLHSSSTITSITVALVGADAMTIRQGVYIVMGANIGTCVTCIMVAFGHVTQRARFQRAMAAATVHDMYNIWSVLVMFPIEILFHPLENLSRALSGAKTHGGAFSNPVDEAVRPAAQLLIEISSNRIVDAASNETICLADESFVIGGAFKESSLSDGSISAIIVVVGFVLLVCSLITMVRMLGKLFSETAKVLISRLLNFNGYVNILLGLVVTFVVHSSTIVTSILTPMAGHGVVTLEQVYPIVLGANVGTTGTALLASLVTGKSNAVAIALVHFWFNVFGVFLFYPIPITRRPILSWARSLAFFSASWPYVAVIFLLAVFLVIPGVLFALVYMCTASSVALEVAGWTLAALAVLGVAGFVYWYLKMDGYVLWHNFLERKNVEREVQLQFSQAETVTMV